MNKTIVAILISCFFILSSCSKNSDFIDGTSQFPLNWKSSDDFTLVMNTYLDTIPYVTNIGTCPLGSIQDPNFGLYNSSLYAEFQTTSTSLKFAYSSVDSIILFMPYVNNYPFSGGGSQPFTFNVYEMTESIDTSSTSLKVDYAYNPTSIGTLANYTVNTKDSVYDGTVKIKPNIKIPLSLDFAKKLIAPGEYASNEALHNVFKGIYVQTNTNTDGFVIIETKTNFRIRIYGKDVNGVKTTSEFVTGGVNSNNVNRIYRDPSSVAYAASQNKISTGSPSIYSRGLFGFYGQFKIPMSIDTFATNKNIFKAELTLYVIDTSFTSSSQLGLMLYNDETYKTFVIDDQYYAKNFFIGKKDTTIAGKNVIQYKYNIGMFLNNIVTNNDLRTSNIRVFPLGVVANTKAKLSDLIPSAAVIGGTGSPYEPKIRLYYTEN